MMSNISTQKQHHHYQQKCITKMYWQNLQRKTLPRKVHFSSLSRKRYFHLNFAGSDPVKAGPLFGWPDTTKQASLNENRSEFMLNLLLPAQRLVKKSLNWVNVSTLHCFRSKRPTHLIIKLRRDDCPPILIEFNDQLTFASVLYC